MRRMFNTFFTASYVLDFLSVQQFYHLRTPYDMREIYLEDPADEWLGSATPPVPDPALQAIALHHLSVFFQRPVCINHQEIDNSLLSLYKRGDLQSAYVQPPEPHHTGSLQFNGMRTEESEDFTDFKTLRFYGLKILDLEPSASLGEFFETVKKERKGIRIHPYPV